MPLLKNYSLAEVTYLLIRCNTTKVFLWNANNSDTNTYRNRIIKQNTYTHVHTYPHIKQSQKDNTEKCLYENNCYPFLKQHPYFINPSLFIVKIWILPFCKSFKKSNSNPFIRRQVGFQQVSPWCMVNLD